MQPSPDSTSHLVHERFSSVADHYAHSKVHAQGDDLPALLRTAGLTGRETVLDAGCGPGPVTLKLAPDADQVTAVDFSQAMLDVARREVRARDLENVRFERSDIETMPFASASFDRVVSRYSAHHWPRPVAVLREFRRLVKSDGWIVLCDTMAPPEPVLDTFMNALEVLRDPSHVRDHSIAQWMSMFAEADLKPEVAFTWDLRLEFTPWVTRMETPAERITAIQSLFDGAGADVRRAFRQEADYTFTVPGVILRGTPV